MFKNILKYSACLSICAASMSTFAQSSQETSDLPQVCDTSVESMYLRGTFSGWRSQKMQWDAEKCVFYTEFENYTPNFELKFDRLNDWSENYGDADQTDGKNIAEQSGENIQGTGADVFYVEFNPVSKAYSVVAKGEGVACSVEQDTMYIRGTFNDWNTKLMTINPEACVWESEVSFDLAYGSGLNKFKFTETQDWSINYGDEDKDGIADRSGMNIYSDAGHYKVQFDPQSKEYSTKLLSVESEVLIVDDYYGDLTGKTIELTIGDNLTMSGRTAGYEVVDVFWEGYEFLADPQGPSLFGILREVGEFDVSYTIVTAQGEHVTAEFKLIVTEKVEMVEVEFVCENAHTTNGTSVYVVGNIPELGGWAISSNMQKLDPTSYPTWTGKMSIPAGQDVEWKCVKASEDDFKISAWESGSNNVWRAEDATEKTIGKF